MNQTQNTKRAVIYCRVSTKEQAEEGNSLVTQERNCREYAIKNDYEVAEVFIEQGESAKTADRTELQRLLGYCAFKKNDISAVISYKIDRISRNTDDYSQIRMLLKRHNIEIKSTSEYFENTPAGRFMENIMANVAQFDNDVRTERSVGGMVTAMREGRYVWTAPTGYVNQKVNGKATIVQDEKAPLIKMVFEGMASRIRPADEIRKDVASLGLCTKNGDPISVSNFYRILKNETYAGWIIKFGERCKGSFEPIISERLFDEVQCALARRKPVKKYFYENPDFPLRRFTSHPQTGEKLTGSWSQGRRRKYAYYRYKSEHIQWPKALLENKFLEFLDSFSLNEALFEQLKKEVRISLKTISEMTKQGIDALNEQEKELKEKRKALVEKNLNGVIGDALFKEHLVLIETELDKIYGARELRNQKSVDYGTILKYAHDFLIKPSTVWAKSSFQTKLKLQWFVFPEGITLDNSGIRTTEICSIFKVKGLFLPRNSHGVTNPYCTTNTPLTANSPTLSESVKEHMGTIENDLLKLNGIFNPKDDEVA